MPLGPRHADRPGRARPHGPSRSPTCWPTRTTAATTSSGWPGFRTTMGAPMLLDDEVVGRARRSGATRSARSTSGRWRSSRRSPARPRWRSTASSSCRSWRRAAPSWPRRSTSSRRCARSARRSARASTSTTCSRRSPCTPSSSPGPTAARSWSTPSRTAASWSAASTGPSPASSSGCGRSASTSTRPSSAGPRGSAGRSRSPDLGAVAARPAPADPLRRRLALAGRRADAARGPDRRVAGRPAQADRRLHRGDARPAGDVREPVGAGPAQRPALPRAQGAERRAGAGQPAQVGVPGEHVPRAAHAAQRRARLLRGAARADVRRASTSARRSTSATSTARASTCWSCSTRSSTCPRSRPAGWSWSTRRSTCGRCSSDAASMLRERAAAARHRARASRSPTTSTSCTPTSSGSSRSCST